MRNRTWAILGVVWLVLIAVGLAVRLGVPMKNRHHTDVAPIEITPEMERAIEKIVKTKETDDWDRGER